MPRRFFCHPESESFWATDDPNAGDDGRVDEIDRDDYLAGILAQFHATAGPRRVVVFGGRTFADEAMMFGALDDFHRDIGIALLIEGEQEGADKMARRWAESRDVPVLPIEARWTAFGGVAGRSRNSAMLVEGQPDCGIAFPGDVGTADMKSQCELAGVPVFEVN